MYEENRRITDLVHTDQDKDQLKQERLLFFKGIIF